MPVYLLHGFRWPRDGFTGIRVHIVVHNLEDCSAEYIQNPVSQAELLKSFRKAFPDLMKELEPSKRSSADSGVGHKGIQFLEQYDPTDETGVFSASQPHAFVGDRVVMIAAGSGGATSSSEAGSLPTSTSPSTASHPQTPTSPRPSSKASARSAVAAAVAHTDKTQALSINVEEVVAQGPGVTAKEWEAFAEIRDKIAPGEKIGWWVVYNGDPERAYPESETSSTSDNDEELEAYSSGAEEELESSSQASSIATEKADPKSPGSQPREALPSKLTTTQKLSKSPPPIERKRPPQPAPKPQMFEKSNPAPKDNTYPPSSPSDTKSSPPLSPPPPAGALGGARRDLGMKPFSPKGKGKEELGDESGKAGATSPTTDAAATAGAPGQGKPSVAPKSDSLKKKLFGGKVVGQGK